QFVSVFFFMLPPPPSSTRFPYTTLFRSHLLGAEVDHPVVEPVARERASGVGFGLGDLAFVVGEDQVLATAVDVEGFPEILHRHRSEEHTSELQSLAYLVCRLLLEKKNIQ